MYVCVCVYLLNCTLCVAPVALAIVFMPGLYPTAYRATFPSFFMRLALVCFYCLCVFVYVLYIIATMSFAGYFLSVLFCLLSMLISDSRFDLVWFRLSCDHGWIRSGSVNVRKQQQQQQHNRAIRPCHPSHYMPLALILPKGGLCVGVWVCGCFLPISSGHQVHWVYQPVSCGTFNMPTSYQQWVWEREANINWSMVVCQGSTRLELP